MRKRGRRKKGQRRRAKKRKRKSKRERRVKRADMAAMTMMRKVIIFGEKKAKNGTGITKKTKKPSRETIKLSIPSH